MSDFSDHLEDAIINFFLRNDADTYTPAATVYLALFTADTGLEANNPSAEVSDANYTREAITFGAPSGGVSTNTNDVEYPAADSGFTCTHIAVVDHETNTTWGTNVNVLYWTAITSKTVGAGEILKFLTGQVSATNT